MDKEPKYNWSGGNSESAEDRALDKFTELMVERISTINQDWKQPWIDKTNFAVPRNLSGRAYNGINSFLLLLHSAKEKYELPVFVTYNQIAYDLNNKSKLKEDKSEKPVVDLTPVEGEKTDFVHVRKGEESFPVFLSVPMVRNKDTNNPISLTEYNNLTKDEQDKYYVRAYTRIYNVFNLDQTNLREARPELYAKISRKFSEIDKQDIVPMEEGKMFKFAPLDRMIHEIKWICPIEELENQGAFYSISKNKIVVPPKKTFIDGESFYGNLLHEMVHSTGSDAYFDRFNNQEGKTGNKRMDYAREELVAELGAAVTAHRYGFDKHIKDDSAAYLKSWLGALKEDPSFLKTTLDDVKKATGLITGKIEDLRLDVREVQTVTIDVNSDGFADLAISESLADKKQGENERSNAAKESAPLEHVETHRAFHR